MSARSMIWAMGVGAIAFVLLAACEDAGSSDGTRHPNENGSDIVDLDPECSLININQTHSLSIGSDDADGFKFVAGGNASHTIQVTSISVNGDLGWLLFDNRYVDLNNPNPCQECDDDIGNGDEVRSLSLAPGKMYYLLVAELRNYGSLVTYDLRVSSP